MLVRTRGVLVVLLLASGAGLLFQRVVAPQLEAAGLLLASDAARFKGTIRVGGDNYLGYWFLTSPEFTRVLRERGYAISWTNDQGAYAERHRKFADAAYDVMVLPINSYLYHGQTIRYPGVIAVALSESKGADSVVGYVDRLIGQESRPPAVNDLNNPNLRICVTPDSPSEFLLNVAVAHFALDELRRQGSWRVATNGSEDAFRRFQRRQCDVAVLWEPDVSRALALPGVASVFGSHQVSEMIVDVFVVRRQLVRDNPDMVDEFFGAYFEAVAHYGRNREQMLPQLARDPAFGSNEAAARALDRIGWFGLDENCRDWFNIPPPGVAPLTRREKTVDTIVSVRDVMLRVGELNHDPLEGNPYRIVNSEVLARRCTEAPATLPGIGGAAVSPVFRPLAEQDWSSLRIIGRIRTVPISFDPSTSRLTREGTGLVDQLADALTRNYPQYRLLVKGHTAPAGDEAANLALSTERALAVRDYLVSTHGVDPNRVRAEGMGSAEPLPRQSGEGELAFRNRLARVEFFLLEDRA